MNIHVSILTIKVCNFGLHKLGFGDHVSQQKRTVRFIKIQVESFYGEGGGLRQLSFAGSFAKEGGI